MRRRSVVHVVVVAGFTLALGSVIARDGARWTSPGARPAATATDTGRPVAGRVAPSAPAADRQQAELQAESAPQAARPPAGIPARPISFIRRPRPINGVALTIDDGPHPVWTPRVLDLLAQYDVHATFCLIGEQVQQFPDLVRRIVAEGHTLCDHSWDHDERLPQRPADVVNREIDSTYDAIVAASGGVRPVYFRAPGGNWDTRMTAEARRLGMVSLNWSVDPRDWSRPGVDAIVSTVLRNTGPGDVVLLHDGGGDRSQTLAALQTILPAFIARGYIFITP